MLIVRGLHDLGHRRPRVVLTVGNFDGLHLGHQALLKRVRDHANRAGAQAAVLTFEPHPAKVLRPKVEIRRLLQLPDLESLVESLGVEWLIEEPFTAQFASLPADKFLELLSQHFDLAGVVVGYDFAFGQNREGTFATLAHWASSRQIIVEQVPPLQFNGEIVSSSRIRGCLLAGDIDLASRLIGRPHFLRGRVVEGEGRGRTIGIRTANIEPAGDDPLVPKNGVYVTRLFTGDQAGFAYSTGLPSVTNVGVKPTFHDHFRTTIEAHVLDREIELLGVEVKLDFLKHVRDEKKFPSVEALVAQIHDDVAEARTYFKS